MTDTMSSPPDSPLSSLDQSRGETTTTFSGKSAVLGMFGFGLLLSLMMLGYWYLNLSEFFPLQKALAAEFPKCTPRVDASQKRDSPLQLRVILQVPEKPVAGNPRVEQMISRTIELIRQHVRLEKFGILQIFLVYREPEKKAESLRYEFFTADLLAGKPQPKVVENP